jgi:hypothetical protein
VNTPTCEEINEATRRLRELRLAGKLPPGPLIVTTGLAFLEHPDGSWHLSVTGIGQSKPSLDACR